MLVSANESVTASATRRLESLVPAETRDRCAMTTAVCHGKPYIEILRLAEETAADLIVLGVHGRKRLDVAMFGSTTYHVVRRAACPVVTLRR